MAEGNGSGTNEGGVEAGKTYDFVYGRLKGSMGPDMAKKYAYFCQELYSYIQDDHDLIDALKQIEIADKLQPMARQLQLTNSVRTLGDVRLGGMAGILNVFVDHFKALAEHNGIELNECSLSIAKVCLDIASAGVGALSSVTGVGLVWLGLSVIATFQDSYELGQVCLASK